VVLEALRIVFGLLLIFVLPGTMLIKAMFPRPGELDEEYNGLYVITLGMATSVCLTILVGFVLGSLPVRAGTHKGWFDAPFIVLSLVLVTVVFFAIAWWRGAFPWLGLVHRRLARFPMPADAPSGTKRHDDLLAEIEDLAKKRDMLKREVKDLLRRERAEGARMSEHYKERRQKAEAELKEVNSKLERAKEQQSKYVYEAKQREDAKRRRREERRDRRERDKEEAAKKAKAGEPPKAIAEALAKEEGAEAPEGPAKEDAGGKAP
jgi:hypothetical protein